MNLPPRDLKMDAAETQNLDELGEPGVPPSPAAGFDLPDAKSPAASFSMRTADVVGVLVICLMVKFFDSFPLWHTDIWGHIAYGEWILDHRQLPEKEPFTPFSDKTIR